LPRWVDIPLRGLKYLLLALFVWVIGRMSVEALAGFLSGPYGIIADVKMLNFFRHIGQTGAIVLAVLTLLSLVVQNFWCRYLCPYGALVGLTALLSPVRIRREAKPCIDCGKCAKACPAWLPVNRLVEIRSAECTACMECVAVSGSGRAATLGFKGCAALALGNHRTLGRGGLYRRDSSRTGQLRSHQQPLANPHSHRDLYAAGAERGRGEPPRNVGPHSAILHLHAGAATNLRHAVAVPGGTPPVVGSGRSNIHIYRYAVEMESGDQPDCDPSA
jgi:ferredoxin